MMRALWIRVRAELRSSWRSWLVLAVLIGVAGGAATAAAAGARRTETAYPRFAEWAKAADVVTGGFPENVDPNEVFRTIPRLPSVLDWARFDVVAIAMKLPGGRLVTAPELVAATDVTGRLGVTIERFKVLSGRTFDRGSPDEAVVDFGTAERFGLSVGDTIQVQTGESDAGPTFTPVELVGIVATVSGFPALGTGATFPFLYLNPGFTRAHGTTIEPNGDTSSLVLRLRGGKEGLPAFEKQLRQAGLGQVDLPALQQIHTAGVQRSIGLEALALWALAGLIVLAAIAVLGQSLARQTYLDSRDFPTLRAVGMAQSQLVLLGVTRAALAGAVAAVLTVVFAVLLSPLTPVGLARIAEPDPGLYLDTLALAVGAGAVLVLTPLVAAFPAWRAARLAGASEGEEEPSGVVLALNRAAPSPVAAVGVHAALVPGRGRTAVPVRSAILASTLAVAALVASILFWTSLRHLLATPRLSGYTWGAFVAAPDAESFRATKSALDADPDVAGYAQGGYINVVVAGESVFGIITGTSGPSTAVIVDGRNPATADEVALGGDTMREAGVDIGDTIEVVEDTGTDQKPPPVRLRVVGKAIIPPSPFGATVPGQGVVLTFEGAGRVVPDAADASGANEIPFLVTFRPDVDTDAALASLRERLPNDFMVPAQRPGQEVAVGRITRVPLALAAILALMAVGTLAQTLVTSIRRRRRDLAILKTLGFVRRQVRGTVVWQATTLALVSIVLGLPLGVAMGRWVWVAFADRIGVVPVAAIGLLPLALVAAGTVVLANAIGAVPGRIAARTKPAEVLRSE